MVGKGVFTVVFFDLVALCCFVWVGAAFLNLLTYDAECVQRVGGMI